VDEVLAVGDAAFQKKCLGKMSDVATNEGRTVLFVSHNMSAVRQLCRQAILLMNGHLKLSGSKDAVVGRYLKEVQEECLLAPVSMQIEKLHFDPCFRLIKVIVQQNGIETLDIGAVQAIEISIEYLIYKKMPGFHLIFQLFSTDDNLIFESFSDSDAVELPVRAPGRYISKMFIPPNFLSAILYELRIEAGIHNVSSLMSKPISIPLRVVSPGIVNRALVGYQTPAKLSPLIEWKTEGPLSGTL
jgi:lipopolysaccharide transport system ATP-binding protein